MPYLLRKIRRVRWDPELTKEIPGLASNECPSDCLADLNTAECSLSLWQIDDDRSNLEDVVIALGSNCDRIANLDYALIDREKVEAISVLKKTVGQSPHNVANDSWHWDLIALSAERLRQLAELMYGEAARVRITGKEIGNLVQRALDKQQLDRTRFKIKFE
jgi:hypothetical protein